MGTATGTCTFTRIEPDTLTVSHTATYSRTGRSTDTCGQRLLFVNVAYYCHFAGLDADTVKNMEQGKMQLKKRTDYKQYPGSEQGQRVVSIY